MAVDPPAPSGAPPRGRRSRAEGIRETKDRILDATERLMADTVFAKLKVEQVLFAADVSRATFYAHYGSKFDVLTELFERTMDDVVGIVSPFLAREPGESPEEGLRRDMLAVTRVWRTRAVVMRAAVDHWREFPALGSAWLRFHDLLIDVGAKGIARERAAGLIPDGPSDRQLAAALTWGTEQTLMVTGLGLEPTLVDDRATVDVLVRMWMGTLYNGRLDAPAG